MEYVKDNGDKVNVKGLTVTVDLGDETMSKINEIKREISHIAEENDALCEYATQLLNFIYPAAHQSGCNRSCPAYKMRVAEIELKNAVLDIAIDMNKDMRRKLEGYEESHIELPKDRGGEYVHSGDVMFHTMLTYEGESNFIVGAISFDNDGAHVWDSRGYEVNADYIQHVKRDTAESIVRDLTLGNISESDAIARIEKLGSQHE